MKANVRKLIGLGADVKNKTNAGDTALMTLIHQNCCDVEIIAVLIDAGADINSKNIIGETAMHFAAHKGSLQYMRVLLDKRADIAEDINEYTLVGPESSYKKDCRPFILVEIDHRKKRAALDSFIVHHIEYPLYKSLIYSTCFGIDLVVAAPSVSWERAEAIRDKYFFDEIFFTLHLHVANLLSRKEPATRSTTSNATANATTITSRTGTTTTITTTSTTTIETLFNTSSGITELANNNNDTSTLMLILTDRLKLYLKPAPL